MYRTRPEIRSLNLTIIIFLTLISVLFSMWLPSYFADLFLKSF